VTPLPARTSWKKGRIFSHFIVAQACHGADGASCRKRQQAVAAIQNQCARSGLTWLKVRESGARCALSPQTHGGCVRCLQAPYTAPTRQGTDRDFGPPISQPGSIRSTVTATLQGRYSVLALEHGPYCLLHLCMSVRVLLPL